MEKTIANEILDKINSTIIDYKNDKSLSSDARTWAVSALAEVKMFVEMYV